MIETQLLAKTMPRNLRESLLGSANISTSSNHHRGLLRDSDDNLDLFSKNRRSLSFAASDESSDVKLTRLSLGSAEVKGELDDLLSSTDGGKHDYDWLLAPPTTPFCPSSKGSESQSATVSLAPRANSEVGSISTTKASRLSVSQSESNHSTRPTRSNHVTRPYVSSYSNYSSNRGTSILNTRPTSPISHSPSTARATSPSTCSTKSQPSSPSKVLSSPNGSQSSRPSTPTSRPQIHIVSNGHSAASASQPRSSCLRVRPSQQTIVPPDFPLDAPANRRKTLPDKAISAGRSRPNGYVTMKANQDTTSSVNMPRRHLSPIVTRGRLTESNGRTRVHSINGHGSDIRESGKNSHVSDLAMWKPLKSSTTTANSPRFGRTVSKKSSDMAIRQMDTRNDAGSIRSLSSTTMFPQSIRYATAKTQSLCSFIDSDFENSNGSPSRLKNGDLSENGSNVSRDVENGSSYRDGMYSAKLSEVDIYESSRYDVMLLKEDLKNTNWLHSIDDEYDQVSIFDNGFEPLPEPFGLL